ncbi:MAG: nucleotidyltransferase domain-containing protein [Armatimonadota bacterium]
MIDLDIKYLDEIKEILKKHVPECKVIAYGSRVTGKAKKYSDLDLAIIGDREIEMKRIIELEDELQNSDIPIRVEILDWHTISDSFKEIIMNKYEVLID